MKLKSFLIALFLLVACNAWAATYYVAQTAQVPAASDSNAGTDPTAPWETIAKVAATATNGDIVYFHSASTWVGATPIFTATAGVKYYGASWGGGTRAEFSITSAPTTVGAVILGASNVEFDGFYVNGNNNYTTGIGTGYGITADITNIKINNCVVAYTGSAGEGSGKYYYGIHICAHTGNTISNVDVTNCIVHDVGHEGISVYPQYAATSGTANSILVRGCEIYNTGVALARQHPLVAANSVNNVIFEFNYIHNVPDAGLSLQFYDCDYGGVNNITVRYNYLYLTTGISLNTLNNDCFRGYGAIYGNVSYGGGLSLATTDYNSGAWKIYNNTFEVDYSASTPSSYALSIMYNSFGHGENIELYNNIFVQNSSSVYVVRDLANAMYDIKHGYNLYFNRASTTKTVNTASLSDANAVTNISVAVTNDSSYTYFTTGDVDFTTKFAVLDKVLWTGFVNPEFNNRRFEIVAVSATEIKVHNVRGGASGPTETATVSGQKWVTTAYTAAQVAAGSWDANAQTTNPTFTGGDLPTGFSGTYGTDMVPNTTYFAITSGDALGNGAVLASDYNKAINYAGTDSTYTRGTAWDIGAYEYTYDGGATIVNTGAVFSGCTF